MKKIKITWNQLISIALWLWSLYKEIRNAANEKYDELEYDTDEDGISKADKKRHQAVKDIIMPYVKKKGWKFDSAGVDRIIDFLVWFIKIIVSS